MELLACDYLSTLAEERSIEWVCNHSRNTLLALNYGYIDIALTYEREQDRIAVEEGWAINAGCIFHDHFCLAGPVSDPAGLQHVASLKDGLHRICDSKSSFYSRADGSATTAKERALWSSLDMRPWDTDKDEGWYTMVDLTPADAIRAADKAGAYLITDRSTLLKQVALQTVSTTTVFFEPTSGDDILMNSCYALYPSSMSDTQVEAVKHFAEYLLSKRGQGIIAACGMSDVGAPLFAPVMESYAKTRIRLGKPANGRWV